MSLSGELENPDLKKQVDDFREIIRRHRGTGHVVVTLDIKDDRYQGFRVGAELPRFYRQVTPARGPLIPPSIARKEPADASPPAPGD